MLKNDEECDIATVNSKLQAIVGACYALEASLTMPIRIGRCRRCGLLEGCCSSLTSYSTRQASPQSTVLNSSNGNTTNIPMMTRRRWEPSNPSPSYVGKPPRPAPP
jgi:hypothetical protein